MSRPEPPQPVKLIVSVFTGESRIVDRVMESLTVTFGPIDFLSQALPFSFTDYYEKEIGSDLFRHLASFKNLISPERLPSIKLYTNDLEDTCLRQDGTRRVNIDPGYVSLCHLILATCKPFSHRPYLGEGVYADMTLMYQRGGFRPLAWTFPDYASAEMTGLLNNIRAGYYSQLKEETSL